MADVTIYTTTYCWHCTRVKVLLQRKSVAFAEVDVTNDPVQRDWLVQTTGRWTVPQVFINGRPIGGADELLALERAGTLDDLLATAAVS